MAEEYFPFDSGPGADSTEARWRRMARVFAQSGVVGASGDDAYAATISGLTLTISRRAATGVAEAWVDGHMHRLITNDWSVTVPANTATTARVDRIVLRLDSTANTVALARMQGTPAASPVAPALTQVDNGIWEIPLWRFTVPANSGAPLVGLTDERPWSDPTGAGSARVVAYGSMSGSQSATSGNTRVLGGLNVSPTLTPGRLYKVQWLAQGANNVAPTVRAIAGATAPSATTGTVVAGDSLSVSATASAGTVSVSVSVPLTSTGLFTVSTAGTYTISPFLSSGGSPAGSITPTAAGAMSLIVTDVGGAAGVAGTTPIAVP